MASDIVAAEPRARDVFYSSNALNGWFLSRKCHAIIMTPAAGKGEGQQFTYYCYNEKH